MIGRDSFILPEVEVYEVPCRKLSIYTEIYDFEAYEFSTCIAYECAIRNNEVKIEISNYHKIMHKNIHSDYNFDKLNMFGINEEVAKHIVLKRESFKDNKYKKTNSLLSKLYNYSSVPKELTSYLSCEYIRQHDGEIVHITQGDDSIYQIKRDGITILDDEYISNVPLLILNLSMHRPKMMNPKNHKHFLVEMNFNAEVDEMIEQIKVMKKVYEDNIKEDTLYRQELEEKTNKIIRKFYGYLDKKKVACANLLNYAQFHEKKKENLSSSELFFHDNYNEIAPRKMLKLKQDTYIDILWVYDAVTSFHLYTEACKKQKEDSIKSLTNEVNTIRLDNEDRRILKSRIINLFEDTQTKKSEVMNQLFKGLKSKQKNAEISVITSRYKLAKDLIENRKYLHLI